MPDQFKEYPPKTSAAGADLDLSSQRSEPVEVLCVAADGSEEWIDVGALLVAGTAVPVPVIAVTLA